MEESDPRVVDHYDDLASYWANIVDSPSRVELLWSTLEGMLPDLSDRRVLDAGCGSGVYASKLVDQGADVIGVDISESMVREARERVPEATFRQANLSDPLEFIADDSVNVVLCQHVFSHLADLTLPLEEFARVLSDEGVLVISTHNPVHDYLVVQNEHYPVGSDKTDLDATVETKPDAPNYGEVERYDIRWNPDTVANRGTYYRRSIEDLFTPLLEAGFVVEDVIEPVPDEAFISEYPEIAEQLEEYPPESICIRANIINSCQQ